MDDIIFGCSTHALVVDFAEIMRREFEMSMMGELSYFLGLQIKQTPQGTFVHQTKYTKDLLRRFKMENCKPISTPIGSTAVLDPDEDGEAVDQKEYRSMIGSLLYLTASRPDIQFAVCLCACLYGYVCMYMYIHIHTCTCTQNYTHMHIHWGGSHEARLICTPF